MIISFLAREIKMNHILNDFISLFFPNFCLGCNNALYKGEELLCTNCLYDLPKTN